MQFLAIQRVVALLLMAFSLTMLTPLLVSWRFHDGVHAPYLHAFAITLAAGLLLWLPVVRVRQELRIRDGFAVIALFWIVLGLFGAMPLWLALRPHLSATNAIFESVSGLTTTGATVLTGLDALPRSLLFYRQQLQWIGGLGTLVLAVAILPLLGVGGMQMFLAKIPSAAKETHLAPRLTEAIRSLGYIYVSLTALCTVGYWLAGMTPFDALAHSLSTVSTGGFSTHDANLGYFDGHPGVMAVAMVFMLLGGASFALHYFAWRRRDLRLYLQEAEFRTYIAVIGLTALVIALYLAVRHSATPGHALLAGLFQAVSIGTTSGFVREPSSHWPAFVPVLLLFVSFIGACANSTGGGLKAMRFLLLMKQGWREVGRLIHPNAVIAIRVGGRVLPDRVLDAIWGFFAAYVALFTLLLILLTAFGLDQVSAFSAAAACLNNMGSSLAGSGHQYGALSGGAKWVLTAAMLFGRMEVFILLALFRPSFWRG